MNPDDVVASLDEQLVNLAYTRYVSQELFSFQWWLLLTIVVVFYIVWLKLVDKSRLTELILVGSLASVAGGLGDIIGTSFNLWRYKVRLLPLLPGPFPYDFTVIPILVMLVFQFTGSWTTYLTGSILASAIFGFVLTPLLQLTGTVQLLKWNYGFAFLIMMAICVGVKATHLFILKVTEGATTRVDQAGLSALHPALQKPLPKETKDDDT